MKTLLYNIQCKCFQCTVYSQYNSVPTTHNAFKIDGRFYSLSSSIFSDSWKLRFSASRQIASCVVQIELVGKFGIPNGCPSFSPLGDFRKVLSIVCIFSSFHQLYACPSVWLSDCLSVYLPPFLPVCFSVSTSISVLVCASNVNVNANEDGNKMPSENRELCIQNRKYTCRNWDEWIINQNNHILICISGGSGKREESCDAWCFSWTQE